MRLRIRFAKHGKVRFTSHRDVARIWERALRRAGVPVAYTEGFSPRPRLSFGLALPTGYESDGEYLELDCVATVADEGHRADLMARLYAALPAGMVVQAVAPAPGGASLQESVVACEWRVELVGPDIDGLRRAVEHVLAAQALPVVVTRKGGDVVEDLRPGIESLEVLGRDRGAPLVVDARLAAQPRVLRPTDLVRALDPSWREGRVVRTTQWTLVDGARREPLPRAAAAGATSTPHASERAS